MVDVLATLFLVGLLGLHIWMFWKLKTRQRRPQEKADEEVEVCANCGYDLRATRLRCPECGYATREHRAQQLARLRNDWPADAISLRAPRDGERAVLLFTSRDGLLVDLLRQHLECRGVACHIEQEKGGVSATTGARWDGPLRLAVWEEDCDIAAGILRRLLPEEDYPLIHVSVGAGA